MRFRFVAAESAYPATTTPAWAAKVERWYQLDEPAFRLCDLRAHLPSTTPDVLLLASPGGCNATDRAFVNTGAASASKFVHTLPNIRSSPLLQVLGWTGPVLCFQSDPFTLATAIAQAPFFARPWIVGASHFAFGLTADAEGPLGLVESRESAVEDGELLRWLVAGEPGARAVGRGLALERRTS